MFVGKQIFVGSWGRYFVGKLCDVTRENNSYLIYLHATERVIFLISYDLHFDVSSSCGKVKPSQGPFSSALDSKNNDRN